MIDFSNQYIHVYNDIKHLDNEDYTVPFWQEKCNKLIDFYSNKMDENFLCHPYIMGTMVANDLSKAQKQWSHIINCWKYPSSNTKFPKEITNGGLTRFPGLHNLSCNYINHLFFITEFYRNLNDIDINILDCSNIVEIGGGFGTLAYLFNNMFINNTYVIIDMPAIIALQKIYLQDNAVVINDLSQIKENTINLVPIGLINKMVNKMRFNTLFGMWSLGECNSNLIDIVLNNLRYNSFMVGTHNWPCGSFNQAERIYKHFNNISTYSDQVGPNNHLIIGRTSD